MYTVSDILADIDRGCMANNMIEDMFSYRIIYFVNEGKQGNKALHRFTVCRFTEIVRKYSTE